LSTSGRGVAPVLAARGDFPFQRRNQMALPRGRVRRNSAMGSAESAVEPPRNSATASFGSGRSLPLRTSTGRSTTPISGWGSPSPGVRVGRTPVTSAMTTAVEAFTPAARSAGGRMYRAPGRRSLLKNSMSLRRWMSRSPMAAAPGCTGSAGRPPPHAVSSRRTSPKPAAGRDVFPGLRLVWAP